MLYQSLFLIVALWLAAVSASVPIPLQSCASGADTVKITSATANVWPPVKGQEFTVDLAATLSQDINGGTYELKVAFDSIPLIDKTGPLTDLNITFPIKAGPISLSKSVQFPNIPISGSIDITIQAKDSNGNEIVCEKISLNLAAKNPVKAVPIPFTSCAAATDIATLSQVTANAWPPVKGSDLIITLYGTLSKAVTNGTYEIKAVFDGILPVLDQKGDLSALTTLPLPAGPITVSKTQNLPSIIPSGSLEITITATSEDGEQILCIKVSVTIASPLPALKAAVPIPYTSCASGTDIAALTQVTANAWPPVKGSDLIITLYGTLSKAVTNGTYEIKAVFDGILPVLDQKGDLSALTTLPLPAGPITVSKTQNLPSIIPSGSLEITITATSEDGEQILCIKVSVTIASPVPALKVSNVPVPYDSCASSSDIATLSSVSANEWPPKKDSDLTITANGNLNQAVNNGTYEIKAKFDGIQILKKHGELSDLVALPLSAGPISISKTVHLPKSIPSGKIQIEVTASDDNGAQILCFKVSVHIKAPAPVSQRAVAHRVPIIVSPFKVLANVPVPASDYSNCGSSADLMPFVSVSASSWPPVAGSSLEMTTTFDAKELVNGGTFHYKAEYMGIVVQDKTDSLANAGFKLPINAGAYSITQKVDAPSGLPAGHIVTTTSATDANGKALFCFVIQFDI